MAEGERILVIKHGGLGDWVLATGCFAAIRAHHAQAQTALLTTPAFEAWGEACGWFDEVWIDRRPSVAKPREWLRLRRRLLRGGFARIYDLQTSNRTGLYHRMLPRKRRPEWSGIARGCSHPHSNPRRNAMHAVAAQAEQLVEAGIATVPPPNLDWLDGEVEGLAPPRRFVLIVPGGAAHRPEKRWPAARYREIADAATKHGTTPVLIGTGAEGDVLSAIARAVPQSVDLCGRTGLGQIAALARRAHCAVGNDTGPIHIAAAVGCPTVVLFGPASDPALCAPQGRAVTVLRRAPLADLPAGDVARAMERAGAWA